MIHSYENHYAQAKKTLGVFKAASHYSLNVQGSSPYAYSPSHVNQHALHPLRAAGYHLQDPSQHQNSIVLI